MKLDGLRVLDLSLFLPGPAMTTMMADHGADVIKVENPAAPEPTRFKQFFPWVQGDSTVMFRVTQRGKRSLTLNLKSPEAKDVLYRLVEFADVFVEAFRPGVMKRLGLDYDTLKAINPRLVYASLSAFGQTGPWRDRPAHDTAAVAAAGVLSLSRSPEGGGPAMIGVAISDMLASQLAFIGVLMALYRRQATGKGDYVDVSMFESVLAASPNIVGPAFAGSKAPNPLEERSHGGNAMLNIYELKDGTHLALGGGEHKFVEELFKGLGRPEFIQPVTGPAGRGHWPAIEFLRAEFRKKTRAEWEQWFQGRDICWMPVYDLSEAWNSSHVREREMRVKDAAGNDHIGVAVKFSEEPGRVDFSLPKVGEHTDDILRSIGYSAEQIVALRAAKAV
ncbi:MAG: CoA transferase [Alphaproteobacteria bacterium]|nr:CoA transferase [Alphaproteobacteria bacterium]